MRGYRAGRDEACNDFSIGIELEGTDEQPYTDAQYEALVGLSRTLSSHYPAITADRIVGHCDIAPGRKTDRVTVSNGRATVRHSTLSNYSKNKFVFLKQWLAFMAGHFYWLLIKCCL